MSFKTKVQKIVLEMQEEGSDIIAPELRQQFMQQSVAAINNQVEEKIMAGLAKWEKGTIRSQVKEVLKELTAKERKELIGTQIEPD